MSYAEHGYRDGGAEQYRAAGGSYDANGNIPSYDEGQYHQDQEQHYDDHYQDHQQQEQQYQNHEEHFQQLPPQHEEHVHHQQSHHLQQHYEHEHEMEEEGEEGQIIYDSPYHNQGTPNPYPENDPQLLDDGHHQHYSDNRSTFGLSTIATDDAADDVARLYVMCESAMPRPEEQQQQQQNHHHHHHGGGSSSPTAVELARRDEALEETWGNIREWLTAHPSPEERHLAATHLGHFSTTALHLVCKLNDPPVDIVEALIDCSPEIATWADSNGWLPLHHACANGASGRVLSILCDAYPDGKIYQDRRKRSPLHFAFFRSDAASPSTDRTSVSMSSFYAGRTASSSTMLTSSLTSTMSRHSPNRMYTIDEYGGHNNLYENNNNNNNNNNNTPPDHHPHNHIGNSMAEIVSLLSNSGAARLPDEGGMLPMHYACAYGTNTDVLTVLINAFPESLVSVENRGRTPLHLAMVNAHRSASPAVLRFLLSEGADSVVDLPDHDGHIPLHLLAMSARFGPEQAEARRNACDCLSQYLDAEPRASADFFSALQALPEWLRDRAVVSTHVHSILNDKIAKRFPTMFLLLDGYMLMTIIACFELASTESIDSRFDPDHRADIDRSDFVWLVFAIYLGGLYFFLREVMQVISQLNLGTFRSWLFDAINWLDMCLIVCCFYFGSIMLSQDHQLMHQTHDGIIVMLDAKNGGFTKEAFRTGVAVAKGVFWGAVISFLKSTLVDFAVFVGGVFYVVRRLLAFLVALVVILLAFAQMFWMVAIETEDCTTEGSDYPHCSFPDSLLKVYTMLMGEVGNAEVRYTTTVSQFLYVAFAFVVVIILSNVLIAIVTDSYGVIKNERAAMVFWSSRLDFVAEMDGIASVMKRIPALCGFQPQSDGMASATGAAGGTARTNRRVQEVPNSPPIIMDVANVGALGTAPRGTPPGAPNINNINNNGLRQQLDQGIAERRGKELMRVWCSSLISLFDPNLVGEYDVQPCSFEFWLTYAFRVFAIFFIVPMWAAAGLVTAGWLWPPQVREWLFVQRQAAISRADIAEQISDEVQALKEEVRVLRSELQLERNEDRREIMMMKIDVEHVQGDVMSDLMQVKDLMNTLLDLTRSYSNTS